MHLWVTLVKEVVRAELPSFESFNSINTLLQLDEDPGDIQEAADRMAHVLNLPADSLMQLVPSQGISWLRSVSSTFPRKH